MHDDPAAHYHGDDGEDIQYAPNPDFLTLNSVGIDIGSSTSHVTFSRLHLQRRGLQFSSRFEVVEREILYRSPILLTPYRDDYGTIHMEPLAHFIDECYTASGLARDEINTGAVICTGEALRKKNSEAITRLFSQEGGKFVCATAGDHLEATLAAHGSGAVDASRTYPDQVILNVDVGGGTSKITVIRNGSILETSAIGVGARLLAWDETGRVQRMEETGLRIAHHAGIQPAIGQILTEAERKTVADAMAKVLCEYAFGSDFSPLTKSLIRTDPKLHDGPVNAVLFSGGVSEYIYDRDETEYGDLGPLLGRAIREQTQAAGLRMEKPGEYIRATVIGSSQYTVQMSSSTIFVSRPSILPIWDRRVIVPQLDDGAIAKSAQISDAIHRAIQRADLNASENHQSIALYIRWPGERLYGALRTLAEGIVQGLQDRDDDPWVLIFDSDIAALVGSMLRDEFGVRPDVMAADEIDLHDLDFVDIGGEVKNRRSVPVVVKSLVFG